MNKSRLLLIALLLSLAATAVVAQQLPPAVYTDPAPDKANPPTMDAPDIISHGKRMNAIIYTAAEGDAPLKESH